MKTRLAALVASLGLTAGMAPAFAAPCRPLITDPRGDSTPQDAAPAKSPVSVDELDILAVDVGSDRKTLTVTVRLAAVPPRPVVHRLLTVLLPAGKDLYQVYWYLGVDEQRFVFTNDGGDHEIPGTADVKSGLVRFRVPRTLLPKRVQRLAAEADASILIGTNSNAAVLPFDSAGSDNLHKLGTRSCL